jgi:hypothetical protein
VRCSPQWPPRSRPTAASSTAPAVRADRHRRD